MKRRRLLRGLRTVAPILAAFAAGIGAAWLVWMGSLPGYDYTIILNYRIEQEQLADGAALRGDTSEEERHRRNVIASFSNEGFKTITSDASGMLSRAVVPPAVLVLRRTLAKAEISHPNLRSFSEAMARGRLALALERAGRAEEAEAEWARAFRSTGRSDTGRLRALVEAVDGALPRSSREER